MQKTLSKSFFEKPIHPERVLQFGEGNFLRAFIDWMLHRMNEGGHFNGSAVVVQPLEEGIIDLLNEQDGLYTLYLRGIENGETTNKHELITSISRGLNPYKDWEAFLETARNPEMNIVVSNTTEAGIQYTRTEKPIACPNSFPAKLTAWLAERFKAFHGSPESAVTFLPCELINHNGSKLKECIHKHATDWQLDPQFQHWLDSDCTFLSTLVDRIVPGYPRDEIAAMTEELGYQDKLICTGEIYHLLVIEGPESAKATLPLHEAGLNVVWTSDMQPYRNRKVGVLNGTHTSCVLAAYLGGLDTVREMMDDPDFGQFVKSIVFDEICPALPIEKSEAESFANAVMERFRNPYVHHELPSISLNSVSKWKVRVLPSVVIYCQRFEKAPQLLSFSLAALIAFYKGDLRPDYALRDDAEVLRFFAKTWKSDNAEQVVQKTLSNDSLWGEDLSLLPGFETAVSAALTDIIAHGTRQSLKTRLA